MQLQCYLNALIVLTMVYFNIQFFQSQEAFNEFTNGMKHHLEEFHALYNAQIDQVLPVVHLRMDGMGSNHNYIMHKFDKHETQTEDASL